MTRQQQIFEESKNLHKDKYNCDGFCPDFIKGAQWADKNPFLNFISVKDQLPELRENVLVLGVLYVDLPIFNSDGERIYYPNKVFDVWFNKRTEPSEHTDGNGFLLLKFHEEYKITHWFPLPKLDGKELYERI